MPQQLKPYKPYPPRDEAGQRLWRLLAAHEAAAEIRNETSRLARREQLVEARQVLESFNRMGSEEQREALLARFAELVP